LAARDLTQIQVLVLPAIRVRDPDSRVGQLVAHSTTRHLCLAGREEGGGNLRKAFASGRFAVGEEVHAWGLLDRRKEERAPSLSVEHYRDRPVRSQALDL